MEIKYIYNKTPLGWVWQLVIDGYEFFYPCGDLKALKKFVKSELEVLLDKKESDSNYGLAFHACGYNGQAQQEYIDYWEKQGVSVFQRGGINRKNKFRTNLFRERKRDMQKAPDGNQAHTKITN